MTVSEKYVEMNNQFCKLRDAIFSEAEDEVNEPEELQNSVKASLLLITQYLDYYKKTNNVKSRVKKTEQTPNITSFPTN